MRYLVGLCLAFAVNLAHAQAPVIFQDGTAQDQRLGDLKTLNGFSLSGLWVISQPGSCDSAISNVGSSCHRDYGHFQPKPR